MSEVDALSTPSHEAPAGIAADLLGKPTNWGGVVTQMRLVKTKEEIALICRAIEITAEGYKKMMRLWPNGTNEGELQAIHEYEMRRRGAVRTAFESIVASGNNATTLHYHANSSTLNAGDLVLVDSGAEYGNYSADITRTWPISGRFSPEQRALYEIVYHAQEAVMKMIRPGVCIRELHEESERVIEEGLRKLGILAENSERTELKRYYPHTIGHPMGLDVHDGCDGTIEFAALILQGLRPNMVITNEPGIYIPNDDKDVEKKWRGIGIRIEDDILVTESGCINLTASLPRHPDDVEKLVNDKSRR
jgi:Xaa-Pro aminopeptidase